MTTGADEPIVDVLAEEWAAIAEFGATLTDEEWSRPTECPGWQVRDLVSHMIGTERSLLGDEPPPALEEDPPHVHNAIGASNEAWVRARRHVAGPAVLAEFVEVTGRRLDELRAFPSTRFEEFAPSPVGQVPYREFMSVRVMDCWVHEQDARVATGHPGHVEGAPGTVALARIVSAMPFVVGKRAAAPDGASVRFDVTGPLGRRIDVLVTGGRAAAVEDAGGQPSATLVLGSEAFWRLGCGRLSGAAAREAGLVEVAGDVALGARVLDSMAFMI